MKAIRVTVHAAATTMSAPVAPNTMTRPVGLSRISARIQGRGQPLRRSARPRWTKSSDAAGRPVALGGPVDAAQLGHRPAVRPGRIGHGARVVEEPLDLALVQVDAHDLSLELVGDV